MCFDEIKKYCLERSTTPVEQLPTYGEENGGTLENDHVTVFRLQNHFANYMYWVTTVEGRLVALRSNDELLEARFEDNFRTVLHRHEYVELGYVIEESAHQIFSEKEYTFPTGSFWFSDQNCQHQDLLLKQNLYTIFFCFQADIFDKSFIKSIDNEEVGAFLQNILLLQKKSKQFISFIPQQPCPEALDILKQMICEVKEAKIGWQIMLKGLLLRLLSLLISHYTIELTNQTRVTFNGAVYSDMLTYIDEHYAEVTLQQLADRYHYSPDSLGRLVKDSTGMSYSEYIQKVRIQKACYYLSHTTDTIDKIIEQVGYHNKHFFYTIFQEAMQMTPKEYRNQERKKAGKNKKNLQTK